MGLLKRSHMQGKGLLFGASLSTPFPNHILLIRIMQGRGIRMHLAVDVIALGPNQRTDRCPDSTRFLPTAVHQQHTHPLRIDEADRIGQPDLRLNGADDGHGRAILFARRRNLKDYQRKAPIRPIRQGPLPIQHGPEQVLCQELAGWIIDVIPPSLHLCFYFAFHFTPR